MFQVSCRGRKSGQSHGVSCSVTNYYRAICKDSHCGYCPRTTSKKHPAVGKSCRSRTTTRYEHRNIEVEIISVSREAITGSESVRNVPSRIGDSPGECRCCNELMSTVKHCENKAVRRDPKKSRSCNGGRVCGRTRCVTEKRVSGDLSKVREGEVARNVGGQGDGGAGRRAQSRERARELVGTGGACIFCEEPARISQEERRGKGGNRQSTNRR